jgi:hypothetical protein
MPIKIDNHVLSLIISERIQVLNLDSFSPADWDQLVSKAQAEGVGPLVYWVLSRLGKFSSVPQSARNSLHSMYAITWRQTQKIIKELEVVAHLYDQADIPAVVLKGACFALTIYPDIGLRQMGDLDLLVQKSKLTEAVRIAKTLGYMDTLPEASPGLSDILSHAICLQKTGQQAITLEIHNSLVADKSFTYAVPVDWFWEQTEPLIASSSQVRFEGLRMLTPTAQALYAAAHAMLQHGGRNTPLRWYYDLDQLIRFYAERMDWDLLLSQARIFEWGSALDAALYHTQLYFDTPIPDNVRASLSGVTDRHQPLIKLLQTQPATHILEECQKLLSLNGYGRFRLVLALVAPSPAYMRSRYQLKSVWALPAYYLYRWWGIFIDAVHTVILLFRRVRPLDNRHTPEGSTPEVIK